MRARLILLCHLDLRDHPRYDILLQDHNHPQQQCQHDAVLECASEHNALLPLESGHETPVAMFCGEIILPITPPEELEAAISTGLRPSWLAATTCRLPNSALPAVSLPDRKTATQPRNGETSGNTMPIEATPRPSV